MRYRSPISRLTQVAAIGSVALGVAATPAAAESLQEAWAKAYSTNPSIAAERARLRAVDEGLPEAKSGWRPTVTLSGDAGVRYTDQEVNNVGDSSTNTPVTLTGQVTQPLYRGGRTVADTQRAKADVFAGRASLANVEQQVLLSVGTSYMDVLRDQAVVELNENNVRVLDRQLQATRDRFSVGEVTRTDVAQAESRLARSEADLQTAIGNLETSRAAYARQVGEPPQGLVTPSRVEGTPENLQAATTLAASSNPVVLQAVYQHESASHVVRLIEGELYPTVNLNGVAQQTFESSQSVDESTTLQALVDVTVPLYQSGSVYARVRSAKQSRSQALQNVEDARRQAIEAATQAWEQLVATRARIVSLGSEIRANEIALEGVQQEALVGTRTVLDILDAEQDLLDSRVNLVTAHRDEFVAVFNLVAAVGGLTAEGLALEAPRYDPKAYYEAVKNQWFGAEPNN